VTQLGKLMLEEIQRRNFTESTTRAYLRIIEDFARYFHRSPDKLGPDHIREYIAHLFRDKKLSDNSVNQTVGALRFFFIKFLKRPWRVDETPYRKKRFRLPVILSQDEVARLIEASSSPFHRTILMTLYATGVRRAELVRLKVADFDSERMIVHI
jgi:integrase/recombinase XerD